MTGRPGQVRAAVRKALGEAREAERMTVEHEVRAALAERYAALVDNASQGGNGAELLRAGAALTELLDTLPIRRTDPDDDRGAGGDRPNGSDGARGKLLSIMDGGPTLGDAAHS